MTPKDPTDETFGNMSQASGPGLEPGLETRKYPIPRPPTDNGGVRDVQETRPFFHADNGREPSPNLTLDPKYDNESHSHYYDTSGTCQNRARFSNKPRGAHTP
jgi:hypothetical protein